MRIDKINPVKYELAQRGLTQREAARRMGVSESELSRLIGGSRRWRLVNARALAFATGIKLEVILGDGKN